MTSQVKGSRLVRREYSLRIAFRKIAEQIEPEGLMGTDVNEKRIDLEVVKDDKVRSAKIDTLGRRRAFGRRLLERLKLNYYRNTQREKRRVSNILHKTSKVVSDVARQENVRPVMDDLISVKGSGMEE